MAGRAGGGRGDVPGARVPGYRVHGVAGRGAAGVQWRATDADGADVAIQLLPRAPAALRAQQERRLEALRSLGAEPSLVRVLDVVPTEAGTAVVTELLDGPSLASVRPSRGALTAGEAVHLVAAVADALAVLHAHGLVHGDVSPANVVLVEGRGPVLVDVAGLPALTRGTPGFAAPERSAGRGASAAGDVWSLAATARWGAGRAAQEALTAVLGTATSEEPAARGTATDLAQRAGGAAGAPGVALPEPAALAAGSLRAAAGPLPPTVLARRRGPGRQARRDPGRGWRLRRRDVAAVVLGVVLAVAAATATGMLPTPGMLSTPDAVAGARTAHRPERPPPAGTAAAPSGTAQDLERGVERLVADRDRALATGDAAGLAALSRPGSAVAAADQELLHALDGAGVRVDGLQTAVTDLAVLRSGPGEAEVEVVLRQGRYTRVGPDGAAVEVPPQPARCVRMAVEAAEPGWRLAAVEPCRSQPTSQEAASSMVG